MKNTLKPIAKDISAKLLRTAINSIIFMKNGLLGNPEDLYGPHYATEEVKQAAQKTSVVIVISNGIDAISIYPLILASFTGNHYFTLLLVVSVTILRNTVGDAAATKGPGRKFWSKCALECFIAMNILMSLCALVAPELLLNRSGIAETYATKLIETHDEKVKSIKPKPEALRELAIAEAECNKAKSKLERYPRGSEKRQDAYVDAYGLYKDRQRDWTQVPISQQPYCIRFSTLSNSVGEVQKVAQLKWSQQEAEIKAASSILTGIKQNLPDLYNQHFDEQGYMKSGIEEASVAINSAYNKIISFKITELGYNLFFFALSVISSIASVRLAMSYAEMEDVQMSFDHSLSLAEEEYQKGSEF